MDSPTKNVTDYFVDEAGDGVLFGRMGRELIHEIDSRKFFFLGMISCTDPVSLAQSIEDLRKSVLSNPLYSSIPSMQAEAKKTAKFFHAKDDHPEIRAKVFELLVGEDFKFFGVVKDMRSVLDYVRRRNKMDGDHHYHPNELYDLMVRMLFKQRLHKEDHYTIYFARRGKRDRTKALRNQLEKTRQDFLNEHALDLNPTLDIVPCNSWDQPCLQVADYCLWALQRCYEKFEDRFLKSIWSKVSLIRDVDDPDSKGYGIYLSRRGDPPDPQKIKNRWV